MYNPNRSILAGRDQTQLQQDLAKLQQAYIDLSSGAKGESFSYTQGDGAKAVTYTRANLADLVAAIQLIQKQLGVVEHPRRALRPVFR